MLTILAQIVTLAYAGHLSSTTLSVCVNTRGADPLVGDSLRLANDAASTALRAALVPFGADPLTHVEHFGHTTTADSLARVYGGPTLGLTT